MRRGRRWEEETRSKYIKKIDICRELIKDCYLKYLEALQKQLSKTFKATMSEQSVRALKRLNYVRASIDT